MHVQEVTTLPLSVILARGRLATFLHTGGAVQHLSEQAFDHGIAASRSAGLSGASRSVTAQTGPALSHGGATQFAIRWTTDTDAAGDPGPVLDVTLAVEPADDGGSRLTLRGDYRPAPGTMTSMTSTFEQILIGHAGHISARWFLTAVAHAVMDPPGLQGQPAVTPQDRRPPSPLDSADR